MLQEEGLGQAIILFKAGKKAEAIPLLKGIIKSNRNNELAWLWLSKCAEEKADRIFCLKEAHRINPNNENTEKIIEILEKTKKAFFLEATRVILIVAICLGIPIFLLSFCSPILSPSMYGDNSLNPLICVSGIIGIFIWFVIYGPIVKEQNKIKVFESQQEEKINYNSNLFLYTKAKENISLPNNASKIVYKKSNELGIQMMTGGIFIWRTKDDLCFFPEEPHLGDFRTYSNDKIKFFMLPINRIEFFTIQGEIFRENKITGGGGGGSSIGGAIVGDVVAGAPGAIIGSRKKIQEVKSELVTHDTRETICNYFDGNKQRCTLFFDFNAFQVLNDLIPEKEKSIVSAIRSSGLINNNLHIVDPKNVADQIRELAKLKGEGLVSDQEFNQKKKELLDKIK